MRSLVAVVLVAACTSSSPKSAPESRAAGEEQVTGGAPPPPPAAEPALAKPTPPAEPPKSSGTEGSAQAAGSGGGDSRAQLAKQNGVLGSTTLSQGSAFAKLDGKGDIQSGFDDKAPPSKREVPPSSLKFDLRTVTGALDKQIIRRHMRRHTQELQACYEKELRATPAIAGTMSVKFTIDGKGRVTGATTKGVHANVESCVADVIKALEFPKPANAADVQVEYVFTFAPGP